MNSNKIAELEQRIIANRFEDVSLQKELCESLYEIGEGLHDETIMGKALFYKAEALFYHEPSECETYAKKSLALLKNSTNYELLARVNNLLGILAADAEDLSVALDYYLTCFDISKAHQLEHIIGLCACNTAVIFQLLESYEEAIYYFYVAIESYQKNIDHPYARRNIAFTYCNIFICYFKLKKIDKLEECLRFIREHKKELSPRFALALFEAEYFYIMQDMQNMKQRIKVAIEECYLEKHILEYIDTYQHLCDFLFELKEYDALLEVLDLIERKTNPTTLPRIRIQLLKYRLYCIESKRDFEEYSKWSKEYVRTYELLTDKYHHSVLESVKLRMYIEELKDMELEYEHKAMIDTLTKLYNRSGFVKFGNGYLEDANRRQLSLAVFIIDVDYFKQVNDEYGHVYGDDCLKQIAEVLSKQQGSQVIASRYGGDEFVLLWYGEDVSEVKKIAEAIQVQVEALRIASKKSPISEYVTLSQGIHVAVPTKEDTLKEFLRRADEALYKVKEEGRNGYRIQ